MARDTKKSKKTRGEEIVRDASLNLETIADLGGTKADLELLRDLNFDEQDDLDLDAEDFESEPIKKDEIRDFMTQIGIWDHRPKSEDEPEKGRRVKLLKAPPPADDATTAAPVTPSTADHASSKQDKKKNKFKVQHAEVSSTTTAGDEELSQHIKTHPQRSHLLVKPGEDWLDDQKTSGAFEVSQALVKQAETFAAKLLEDEIALYTKQRENSRRSESRWIKTVLTSGTLSDKMAALTLLVQESALHSMAAIDTLVNMSRKKGKREAMLASDTLKDLFLSNLLPDNRKLVAFEARPLSTLWRTCSGNKDSVDKRLMCWHAESLLKKKYAAFIKALDVMSYDTILATKQKALSIIHSLLVGKPEHENVLLPMIVNKLGDPDYKLASKTSYLLIKLVEEHPNMKSVIVAEVERLVYRPNISQRAQYYAMCFLNQIKLGKTDQALATQLISIYFSFFKVYVKKGEVDSKMMAALLSGVNRAYPFAKLKRDFLEEQMSSLYRIVHIVTFNTSVQALMLLCQVTDTSTSESDRYFMALYRKLADPALKSSAKQPQFLNLLYKSLKADVCEKRVQAFMKRLLQTGCQLGPNFLTGALIVLSEVLRERPGLLNIKQMGKANSADSLAVPTTVRPGGVVFDSDDEEEHFVDLPVPAEFKDSDDGDDHDDKEEAEEMADAEKHQDTVEEDGATRQSSNSQVTSGGTNTSSWVHRQNLTGKSELHGYDAYQRNPLYCRAQHECLWELRSLALHYHPSVSLFAKTILDGNPILYSGDPLQDFTLIRFLDRFVYKNPKKREAGVQDQSATVGGGSAKAGLSEGISSVPVNSEKFLQAGEAAVPEHERYLYKYFSQRAEKKKAEEAGDLSDVDSEAESVSDTEFDDFLDTYERQVDGDDLDDMDGYLDFAGDLASGRKKKTGRMADDDDDSFDDDVDDDEDDGDLSDEEVDFGDDDDELAAEFRQEMEGLSDEGGSDEDLSGDELKQMMSGGQKKSSKKRSLDVDDDMGGDMDATPGKKAKRKSGNASGGMFAAADEFADLLEDNVDTTLGTLGTTSAVSNKDKAAAKQLAWEADRDRQIRGRDWRHSKRPGKGKGSFRGNKPQHSSGHRGHKPGGKGHNFGKKSQQGHTNKKRK